MNIREPEIDGKGDLLDQGGMAAGDLVDGLAMTEGGFGARPLDAPGAHDVVDEIADVRGHVDDVFGL